MFHEIHFHEIYQRESRLAGEEKWPDYRAKRL